MELRMSKIWKSCGLSVLLLLLLACSGDDGSSTKNLAGKYEQTLTLEGMEREFIVYVPESAENETASVVFMLHGTGGDGEKFYNISGWKEKADQEGFIVVFPSALTYCYLEDSNYDGVFDSPQEIRVKTKWDSGYIGDEAPLCDASDMQLLPPGAYSLVSHQLNGIKNDITFFEAMLDHLQDNYDVDTASIYATGFSNGGGMVSRIAVEMSDRFAVLASSAGIVRADPNPTAFPRRFVLTLGNVDSRSLEFFNYYNDPDIMAFPLDETLFDIPNFKPAVIEPLLSVLQLKDSYSYELIQVNGVDTGKFTYSDDLTGQGQELLVYIIDDLDHQYPNGNNHPFVISDFLWEFFRNERL